MAAWREAVGQTRDHAYAHHIQRLMVTGNFALLAGLDPREVHEWYLAVYADAFEWVEAPNTIGMSQFADGGVVGSKPYVSSGDYIDRMSDYCTGCAYDVKRKPAKKPVRSICSTGISSIGTATPSAPTPALVASTPIGTAWMVRKKTPRAHPLPRF